jgi:hypothetical protein
MRRNPDLSKQAIGGLLMRKLRNTIICVTLAIVAMTAVACSKKAADSAASAIKEEVGSIPIPAGIVAFGGVKSLTDISNAAVDLASSFNKGLGAMLGGQVTALLQSKVIGTRNITWMDPGKAMKFVVLDPKLFNIPIVFIAPVLSEEGLTAALTDSKPGTDGNELSFQGINGRTMYMNRIEKNAIFTMEAGAFAAASEFIKSGILNYPNTELIDMQGSAENLKAIIKPYVESQKAAVNPQNPKLMDLLVAQLESLSTILDQAKAVRVVLRFNGTAMTIEASGLALEGTAAAKFATDTASRKLTLFKRIPAEGWLESASSLDPSMFKGISANGFESMATLVQLTPEEKAAYEKLVDESMAAQSGESAFWIGHEGKFPFKVIQISGMNDGEKGRASIEKIYDLLFSRIGKLAASKMPAENMPVLDWTSLDSLLSSSKGYMDTRGVKGELKKVSTNGVDIKSLDFSIDSGKFAADDPDLLKFKEVIGEKLSAGIGFDKSTMFMSLGRDSVGDIEALRKGDSTGSAKLSALIAGAGYDVAMALRLSVVDATRLAAVINSNVSTSLPGLATTTTRPDLAIIFGSRDGRVIIGSITIPTAGIAALLTPPPPPAPAPVQP